MRRGRILIILAIIVLLGVFALFYLMRTFGQPAVVNGGDLPQTSPLASLSQIVIAARDIPRGSTVGEGDIILAPFPMDMVVETMLTDREMVVGRTARMDIGRGVPVTENMVTDQPGRLVRIGSDASLSIPPGFTAIAIPLDRLSGVAYALRDGDSVDVIVSMLMVDVDAEFQTGLANNLGVLYGVGSTPSLVQPSLTVYVSEPELTKGRVEVDPGTGQRIYVMPAEEQRPRLVSQRLIQAATVLHVGNFPLEEEELRQAAAATDPAQGVGSNAGQGETVAPAVVPPDIISLIVTPQDALALNWAIKSGADIVLTLRSPNDVTLTDTTSVTLQYLMDNYRISVPSKLSVGTEPRLTEPIKPILPYDNLPFGE